MRSYSTQYVHNGATFASEVIADNDSEAERLIKLRGLGEVIVGYPFLNTPESTHCGQFDLLKEIAFTGWVASKSMPVDDVLGPKGWMGEYLLMLSSPCEPMISRVNVLLDRINEVRATLGMPLIRKVR
jgi:hypothetical protein